MGNFFVVAFNRPVINKIYYTKLPLLGRISPRHSHVCLYYNVQNYGIAGNFSFMAEALLQVCFCTSVCGKTGYLPSFVLNAGLATCGFLILLFASTSAVINGAQMCVVA